MTYEELVEVAERDDSIVGLVLTGSRGRGYAVTDDSDWDVRLVVSDDVVDRYRSRYATPHGSEVEVVVLSLTAFRHAGEVGSSSAWDRYSYVDAQVVVDRAHGLVGQLVLAKSVLPEDQARSIAAERLDDYVNAYYRAAKNVRAGLENEARLDASESIPPLLDFLFATHERVRPFNRFLRWELERRLLPDSAFSVEALFERLAAIGSGDLAEQQRTFREVEALARAHGHGRVIDGWEPDVGWLRGD